MKSLQNKKSFLSDNKAQGSMMSFFSMILGIIILVSLLPILNSLSSTIAGTNMDYLANADIIRLVISMCGVIMVILFLISVVSDFQTRQQFTN